MMLHPDDWPCLQRSRQCGVDGDHQLVRRAFARLVLGDADASIDDVGPEHLHDITAALCGMQQQRERQPLSRAERPAVCEFVALIAAVVSAATAASEPPITCLGDGGGGKTTASAA
jgi:hypothetical protein